MLPKAAGTVPWRLLSNMDKLSRVRMADNSNGSVPLRLLDSSWFTDDRTEEQRKQIISESTDKFVEWLYIKIQEKADSDPKAKSMAIRLKAAHNYHDPKVFEKFPELESYMMDAFKEFVEELKNKNK